MVSETLVIPAYWIGLGLTVLFVVGYLAYTNDAEGWSDDFLAMTFGAGFYALFWPVTVPITIAWAVGRKFRKQ